MNKRIQLILSYINKYDNIMDVGCDQAILSEYLAKKNIFSIASDIRKNIIESASKRIKNLNLDKYVKFIVTDGLENTQSENIDTLVLSGMGSYTILKILKNSKKKYKKIITVSNNNHDILRSNMLSLGYKIKFEEIIFDKNKFYNLIVFIPGTVKYSNKDLLVGKNHKNIDLLNEKLKMELKKYKKIYVNSKNKVINKKIKVIEKMLKYH